MRYEPLGADLYERVRGNLADRLPAGSLLVLHSNDVMPTNADGVLGFHQNANLFYLTGIDQEETVLFLRVGQGREHQATLLVRETNDTIKIWEGERLSQAQATELSGIEDVRWTTEYASLISDFVPVATSVYIEDNTHPRCTSPVQTRNARYAAELKQQFPELEPKNVFDDLAALRMIKQPEEIEAIRKACRITAVGFIEGVLPMVGDGSGEWQMEAALLANMMMSGSRKFAFPPIIASGANTCVLHYVANDKMCRDGDLILSDIGAEYGNYNADMTRVVPVNGKFSPRQRDVYEAVRHTLEHAKSLIKPGVVKLEYEKQVRLYMAGQLVQLGLITQQEVDADLENLSAVKKYFMHGCSHSLGLDVHDVTTPDVVFAPGMVFTVEPGIYIPAESIGIRLETDVLVTEDGVEDLLDCAPILPDAIEYMMYRIQKMAEEEDYDEDDDYDDDDR